MIDLTSVTMKNKNKGSWQSELAELAVSIFTIGKGMWLVSEGTVGSITREEC